MNYVYCRIYMYYYITHLGEPVTFNLSVRPAPNFPLDLYLLMDLSYSMRDDLDNLKGLGSEIGRLCGLCWVPVVLLVEARIPQQASVVVNSHLYLNCQYHYYDLCNIMFILFLSAETIGNITTNFRLGFGSFVDKRVAPYVSTRTDRLIL